MTLYEINNEILSLIDFNTGEVSDFEKLAELTISMDEKKENIALYIKNLTSDADEIAKEIDMLRAREVTKRNQADRLKEYLSMYLDGNKFETPRVSCRFKKSAICEIDDENVLMQKYPEFAKPQPPKISKSDIKKSLKAGISIDGARIIEKLNLQIR